MSILGRTLAQRLADNSKRVGKCLIWTARKNNRGYGVIGIANHGRTRNRYAHRVAYEVHHGEAIADGMKILHSCDTPACIEPTHLRCGTQRENAQDAKERRRHPRHLSPEVVAEVFARQDAGERDLEISSAMGIPYGTITARRHRRGAAA